MEALEELAEAVKVVVEIRLERMDSPIQAGAEVVEMVETVETKAMAVLAEQVYSLFDMLVVLPQVVEQ